jgi:hypothetical protein
LPSNDWSDPIERDFRNRKLGKAGECFVFQLERKPLIHLDREDLPNKVRLVAEDDGDGAGFDSLPTLAGVRAL